MTNFICPNCKSELLKKGRVYTCKNNHCFDISKDGYVNLLMSQQSSLKRHGDDKLMVRSRRDFLNKGYYQKLKDDICNTVKSTIKQNSTIIDVGCGEGYYTEGILGEGNYNLFGIDISKDALKYASKLLKHAQFAVASAFNLPFGDASADCILNIFAPSPYEEFYRVLKDEGVLIKAVPLEEHLWDLKCAVYKSPYKNKPEIRNYELFKLVDEKELKYKIEVDSPEDIANLFRMTPYYYKTSKTDTEALLKLAHLTTTVHFKIEVFKKINRK